VFAAVLTRIREDHGRPGKPPTPLIRGMIDFLAALKEPDYGPLDFRTPYEVFSELP
jgi:hypothetical protein